VRVLQIRRYESGASQPALDSIRRLALALGVTTDELIFDKDERGPDEELRLQFEAISRFDPEEKKIVEALLEGMILKHEASLLVRCFSQPAIRAGKSALRAPDGPKCAVHEGALPVSAPVLRPSRAEAEVPC